MNTITRNHLNLTLIINNFANHLVQINLRGIFKKALQYFFIFLFKEFQTKVEQSKSWLSVRPY